VKAETAAKIIGQIYDCVFQPDCWPGLLKLISSIGENAGSSIVVHDRAGVGRSRVFEHGADQSHLRLYFEKLASMKLTASGRPHFRTLGDITTLTMLCGEKESIEHDFYIRWVKPSGFRDMIGVLVLKSGRRLAWFSVARTEVQTRYRQSDLEFMDWLAPHICRAFTMADIFDMQAIRLERLEQTVDALSTGVFLADHDGITYMNSSAKKLIDRGATLKIKNNRLTSVRPRAADRLSHAISASLGGAAPEKVGTHMVAIPDVEGGGLLANVLPLSWQSAHNPLVGLPGSAAIFVQDASAPPQFAGKAFAKLYGLTPAELRVSLEVAKGNGLHELTEALGISANTVKTHLKHVFAKTGVTRQGDLTRLIMMSTPPIRSLGDVREQD
jgi:DNA-binding CsgD family transcriptional regulator/PAS domain-containing protein